MKLKKVIALFLAVCMLPLGQLVFAAQNEAAGGNKAGWFIDAENFASGVVSDENAVGGKAASGSFEISFSTPEAKNYYLHAKIETGTSSANVSYEFNSDAQESCSVSATSGAYKWVKLSGAKALKAGENTVKISVASGIKVDGIIVSELSALPFDAAVGSVAYSQAEADLAVYPDVFNEKMTDKELMFKAGDRVLFLGDSITHSVSHTYQYHTWILTYYATRYPDSEFSYINAGRSGDTTSNALKRLVSDINIHDFNKIVIMLGTNDVNRITWDGHRDDQAACDAMIEKYITNLDALRKNFTDKEIILMGPTYWNEFTSEAASSADNYPGYNSEIRRVNNYLKDYAHDNGISYIDLNTAFTKVMLYNTRKNPDYLNLFGSGDRTHPNETGHYVMAYNFLKAQGVPATVAAVNIDASNASFTAENAAISNVVASADSVSYTYQPKALPLPADSFYRKLEKIIPVADELNREIIKVTGLNSGKYTIKMNGVAVMENVSSVDLAEGVNIADLQNNPNQKKTLALKSVIDKRSAIERANIRNFRADEFTAITTTANGLNQNMSYDELIAKASTVSSLASYVQKKKALYNYFGAIDYLEKLIYTINKPGASNVTIERTGDIAESVSQACSYTTEAVSLNEGSPEIVFHTESEISKDSDFEITNGIVTAYKGNAENVYIPVNATGIASGAIGAGAKYVYVPASVKSFEEGAFKNLDGADVHFSLAGHMNKEKTFKQIDGVTFSGEKILYFNPTGTRTYYEIEFGKTAIADYAFANAKNLSEVIIPDTVTEIGEGAFDNTNLTVKCHQNSVAHNYAAANGVNYEIIPYSDNADLSSLSFNGTNVWDFDADKTEYDITLFANETVNVSAEALEATTGATVEIENNGAAAPCTVTVKVTAQDEQTVKEYKLKFTVKQGISNLSNYINSSVKVKSLRLDGKYATYVGFDADENNQFIINSGNTSNEFGYGLVIQRHKGDASGNTYKMPFYSNNGDPLLGAADGRYWMTFDIIEDATVYVAINEGKQWVNGENNGWKTDDTGLEFYDFSGSKLYKKHFKKGTVSVPSFGTHSSYEQKPDTRIEWNPSGYAVIFDSSFATEEDKNSPFAVTKAAIGSENLSETEAMSPELERDVAYDLPIMVEGSAPAGESITLVVTPVNDESTLIAMEQTTASAVGKFSFEALCGDDLAPGVTYKAEITTSKQEKYTYYFKTIGIKHNVVVTPNPELGKYLMNRYIGANDIKYADTKLGDKEVYEGNITMHKTEVKNGIITPVKENNAYVMENVKGITVGVQFSSERGLHRTGIVGSALKGLNHIVVNQNASPGRMKDNLKDKTLTWEGESITIDELSKKYNAFFAGNNVFYSFVPDAAGTAYVALTYENQYFEQMGWGHMQMLFDDIPQGYAEWNVVPESTHFSTKYPYQLAKFQHDSLQINIMKYNHVYYRSFDANEKVDVYTGGSQYEWNRSELPKTMIRWGEHISIDTDFELSCGGKTVNISSDTDVSVEGDSVTLKAESKKGAKVVLSQTNITSFPTTVTANVTAQAGNTATYKIVVDQHIVSTKLSDINYTITGISGVHTITDFDKNSKEFSVKLPHADSKAKLKKNVTGVTASVTLVDKKATYTTVPADGVLDFSENGRADMTVNVTDSEGNKESYVIHFSVPVYNIQTKSSHGTLRKLYGKNQISGYEGYSTGELAGYETAGYAPAGAINAANFPLDAYVIARNKGDAGSITKTLAYYGGATYTSDETGWWMTFTVTDDSYVYVYDTEGWGWPNKDTNYWTAATNLTSNSRYYVHFAKAGETVKIPNYGYLSSWEKDPANPQRLTKDPSYYIVMPVETASYATLSVNSIAGDAKIKIDEKTYDCFGTTTMDVKQGGEVELTADGDNFMYWTDAVAGRILSYNEKYTFTFGSDRTINAVYRDDLGDNVYYVMFKNANNVILSAGYTSSEVYVPQNPYMAGYNFNGWYIDGKKQNFAPGTDVSQNSISKDTVISAGYEYVSDTFDLYIDNLSDTAAQSNHAYNEKVTVVAPAAESGKVFVYWMRDGQVVSYNETYSFYMGLSDVHLTAVYAASAENKDIVITMSEPVLLGGGRISFMAERSVPEGFTLVESGIVLGTTPGLSIGNALHKVVASKTDATGQFTVRKANVSSGDTWYARAYVMCKKDDKIITVYSNEVIKTYAE